MWFEKDNRKSWQGCGGGGGYFVSISSHIMAGPLTLKRWEG